MELSLVVAIAAAVGYYLWCKRSDRRQQAIRAYCSALSSATTGFILGDDPDEAFAERLDSIFWSLTRAESMKTSDWRDKPGLMETTWKDVCSSIYDERVLRAAHLSPGRPGYTDTIDAVTALSRKLEKARPISGWVP